MRQPFAFACALAVFVLPTAGAFAEDAVQRIDIYPPNVDLTFAADSQSLVVQATFESGLTRDVSNEASLSFANDGLVRRDGMLLFPVADGETELTVTALGATAKIPVKVAQSSVQPPVSFTLDVMPIFTRSGCNTGSCHGAARGKDGFRLSLFGYDPAGDHYRITREMSARRINLAVPEASLLVEKSIGVVPHTGGKRFSSDSPYAKTLTEWVSAGCPQDPAEVAHCTGIEVYPPSGVLDGADTTQQMTVRATYSDGTTRDITSLAAYSSSNDNSASINEAGQVTAANRGEAFIMARFDVYTVGVQFIVLPKGLEYEKPTLPERNYIDELVHQKLDRLRIVPSGVCSDEIFVRRLFIDLIGQVPSEEEFTAFMTSTEADKRDKLINELIDRKEFTELWVSKWAEWLMMRSSNQTSYKSIVLYYNWLADQIANNVPLDQMVRDILSANGGTFKTPQTNFYQIERDTLKTSENVAQVFMGMRIQCAQCHNHPFDRWTQDDYYSFAAFFSQIGRKNAEDYRETIIFNRGGGDVRHPVGNRVMPTVFLGGGPADTAGKDRREVLAEWLASPKNPYFAQNFANRIWHHFFGIGIIEPIDDVRVSNPPSNKALLEELAKRLTESGYDFKGLVREICQSNTYQRSTERNDTNMTDELNFAHQNPRRVKAESVADILAQVTGVPEKYRGLPVGSRAVQIADGRTSSYFLTTFGRATRETACSCEVKMEPTLSQALHLLNGSATNDKIRRGGLIAQWQKEGATPDQMVEKIYIRCLSRKPTAEELAGLQPLYAEGSNVQQGLEDIFWAVLNGREFLFNH